MTKTRKTELLENFKAFLKSKNCDLLVKRVKNIACKKPAWLTVIDITQTPKGRKCGRTICYAVMERAGSDDECCMEFLESLCGGGMIMVEQFEKIGLKKPGSLQELALTLAISV